MKKYMDKLKKYIHINKSLFLFLLIIVIIGVVAGGIYGLVISSEDKQLVAEYLNSFFNSAKTNKLNYNSTLSNTLIFTLGIGILIWILGISVIGFILILIILFVKSFILGFSLTSIILNFKLKGILYSFVYVFPHQIINILVFILLSGFGLVISFKIIRGIKTSKIDFKNLINRYFLVLFISIFTFILTSLYEVYIVPKLLYFIMKI